MKEKWTLFVGIILLIAGIILRKTTGLSSEGLVLIIIGVLFKTYYIVSKAKSGEYKPGYELLFLLTGLILFLTGLYLRANNSSFNPSYLIYSGISLKVVFIVLFIVNTRKNKQALVRT